MAPLYCREDSRSVCGYSFIAVTLENYNPYSEMFKTGQFLYFSLIITLLSVTNFSQATHQKTSHKMVRLRYSNIGRTLEIL